MTRPLPLFQPRTLGSSAGGFACENWLRQHYPLRLNRSEHLPAPKWATVNTRNCVGEDLLADSAKRPPIHSLRLMPCSILLSGGTRTESSGASNPRRRRIDYLKFLGNLRAGRKNRGAIGRSQLLRARPPFWSALFDRVSTGDSFQGEIPGRIQTFRPPRGWKGIRRSIFLVELPSQTAFGENQERGDRKHRRWVLV